MSWRCFCNPFAVKAVLLLFVSCGPNLLDPNYSDPEGRIAFIGPGDFNTSQIYLVRPDGEGMVRVTNADAGFTGLSWSPDARRLAYSSNRDALFKFDIFVMNLDGSDLKKVADLGGSELASAWSPDGRTIAFQADRDDLNNWDIYVINVDSTGLRNLTASRGGDELPAWSPNGDKLAFQTQQGANVDIFTIEADGSNRYRLTEFNGAKNGAPAWSPDGSRIAFESNRHQPHVQNGFPEYDLYIMNSDGTRIQRLTYGSNPTVAYRFPTWSPDGTKIAFEAQQQDIETNIIGHKLMVMNVNGTDIREIHLRLEARSPRWSPRKCVYVNLKLGN